MTILLIVLTAGVWGGGCFLLGFGFCWWLLTPLRQGKDKLHDRAVQL